MSDNSLEFSVLVHFSGLSPPMHLFLRVGEGAGSGVGSRVGAEWV